MSVKHLDRRRFSLNRPVEHSSICDNPDNRRANPFPESDILRHRVRLDLGLELNVENLELVSGCFQENRA